MTLSSEQLEREAERARAKVADTLDELRSRISPGQVVDEFVDYARDGGIGDFARNLGNEVRANPLPVALIGAGLAWLMMSNGRSARMSGNGGVRRAANAAGRWSDDARATAESLSESARSTAGAMGETARSTAGAMSDTAGRWAEGARTAAESFGDRTRSAADAMSEAASSTRSRLSDAASRAQSTASSLGETASAGYQTAAESAATAAHRVSDTTAAMGRRAADAGRSAADASRTFFDFAKEQPLVLAGIGLALGAALGSALPSTETEDRLMGDASDEVKAGAAEIASEQYHKVQAVAEKAINEAAQAAEHEGVGKSERLENALDTHRESSVVPSGDEGAHSDEVHARS